MIIKRMVVSLFLILFAGVTIGVILGLDDAARSDLAGRLPSTDPTAVPATPSPADVPSPSLTAAAKPKPTPLPTAAPTAGPTKAATPRPSATKPGAAKPTASSTPKPKPTKQAPPAKKPTTSPEQAKKAAKKKPSKYLQGKLTKGPGGTVYLTFDDGPSPYTAQILSILSRTGSTATFFHLGVNEGAFPHADAAIRKQGSKVANHSYDHPDLTTRTAAQLKWQLQHGPKAKCFRPPYGATNAKVQKAIKAAGMRQVLWDVDTLDWSKPGVSTLAKTGRLKAVRNGSIILMHDGGGDRSQTVAALPTVIKDLKARGFTVRALPYC